jgi:hypothetical protein
MAGVGRAEQPDESRWEQLTNSLRSAKNVPHIGVKGSVNREGENKREGEGTNRIRLPDHNGYP